MGYLARREIIETGGLIYPGSYRVKEHTAL